MKKYSIVIILFFISNFIYSQYDLNYDIFRKYEDTISQIAPKVYKGATDEEKNEANNKLLKIFEKVLRIQNAYTYPFVTLKSIGRLESPDKKFVIFNWNLPLNNGTHKYYAYILLAPTKQDSAKLIPLCDKSIELENILTEEFTERNWFGALYYKIILTKVSGKKYYTLLGWDGNDNLSTKKIIDVLSFTIYDEPRFGATIFNLSALNQNIKYKPMRMIFEYSSDVTMSLKYEKQFLNNKFLKKSMIIFDHLAPKNPSLVGQYQFYGPDMSYDALVFKKGKWNYKNDVDARNVKEAKKDIREPQMNLTQ